MNERKKLLIQVTLNYIFADEVSQIVQELPSPFPGQQRVEFLRPHSQGLHRRFYITWTPEGDFAVWEVGSRGANHPCHVQTSRWFRVHAYLKSNFISVKQHLNIPHI